MLRSRRRRRTAGFSLIELMVVIAIMGLLATVVAVNLMGRTYDAKVKKVMADFDSLGTAIKLFNVSLEAGKRSARRRACARRAFTASASGEMGRDCAENSLIRCRSA